LELKSYHKNDVDNLLSPNDMKNSISPTLNDEVSFIRNYFNKNNIFEIYKSLKENNSKWSDETLNILEKKSPTSMGVATKQLYLSKKLDLKDCLSMEFRICQAMMARHDFYEGVRANLVDKDRSPNWKPKLISNLNENIIDEHFNNLNEKELF
jgi:enoyl-CoA hydratase